MSGRRRPRTQKRRAGQPRTLRTRLVVASVVLIAVVCAVIGTVTTLALRSHLYDQLDDKLTEAVGRAAGIGGPPGGDPVKNDVVTKGRESFSLDQFVTRGPQPSGTVIAKVENGSITDAAIGEKGENSADFSGMVPGDLTESQIEALNEVAQDDKKHTVDLGSLGEYRVEYKTGDNGSFYVAIPTAELNGTLNTLILIEASVTAAALVAAGIAGTVIVGVATRPLRRVAATATRVSELPCTPAR